MAKQITDKLNEIAKAIDPSIELPSTNLITDSLDAITKAYGGTPTESNLIVDKLDDIADVATGGSGEGSFEFESGIKVHTNNGEVLEISFAKEHTSLPTFTCVVYRASDTTVDYDEGFKVFSSVDFERLLGAETITSNPQGDPKYHVNGFYSSLYRPTGTTALSGRVIVCTKTGASNLEAIVTSKGITIKRTQVSQRGSNIKSGAYYWGAYWIERDTDK